MDSSMSRGGYIVLGIILVLLGLFVIWGRVFTSFASVFLLGVILFVVGIVQMVQAFFKPSIGAFFLNLFLGILSLVVGGVIMLNPGTSLLTLTFFFTILLFVTGFFQFFYGVFARPNQWGTMLAGVVNVILAIAVYNTWPVSGFTAFGWVLGLSFIASGFASIVSGFTAPAEESVVQPTTKGMVSYSSEIKKPRT